MDWRFQVYCNGHDEHYIDLACPYGKTNSPLKFCPPVALFAESAAVRYGEKFGCTPSLGSYVDDTFGGFKVNPSHALALHFREWICTTGTALTLRFNMKVEKTPLPNKKLVVLGRS